MKNIIPLGIKIIALMDCAFGIFILGWFFRASNSLQTAINALLSSCPCAIVAKIAVLVVFLLIILFIKSSLQVFQLNPKGREDHINFSSLGIFVLLFPVLCTHNLTAIIGGLLIVYLAWSIFYLNSPRTKKLFQV